MQPRRGFSYRKWLLHSLLLSAWAITFLSAAAQEKGKPTLVVQNGHFGVIRSIAYSADERLLASASEDGTIKLWATDSGILLRTLNANSTVHYVAFSPDGQTLAASTNTNVKFWKVENGELKRTLEVKNASYDTIFSVKFTSDWKLLVVCLAGGMVNVWDASNYTLLSRFKTENFSVGSKCVATFSPDDKILAFSDAKTIKLYDVQTGALLHTLAGHLDDVISLAFNPDGRVLASGSGSILTQKDNSARLWDVPSGALLHTLQGKVSEKNLFNYPVVQNLAFSPNGKQLLTEGQDNALKLWDVTSGKLTRVVKDRFYTSALALSPGWETYASENLSDHAIQFWDMQSGALLHKFAGQSQGIGLLTFSPDGKQMAVTVGGNDDLGQTTGYVWDFQSGPISSLPIYFKGSPHLIFKRDELVSVGIDMSGKVSVGQAMRAGLEETIRDNSPDMVVGPSTLAPNGQMLAVADVNKRTIRLWDLQQRKLVHTFAGHTSVITSLAFSPDGQQLASASWDKTIKLWDVRTGQLLRTLEGHTSSVTALAFSPDGKTLASGSANYLVDSDHSIRLWDRESGRMLASLEGHDSGVALVSISPDNKTLVSAGANGELKVWDIGARSLLRAIPGTGVAQTALAFHPSGRFIVTGNADGTIKILSSADAEPIATIIAFNDGNWLITSPNGLFDGSAAAWERILWRFSSALRDVAPVEIFFSDFYYPDLLTELLGGHEPKVATDITQKDRRQPRLAISLADKSAATNEISTRYVKVRVDVTEATAGAQDTRLFRNGSLVHVWHGDVLKGQSTARLELTVPIIAGENRITAYSFNHDNIKSADATLVVNGASSLKREAIAYVLVVGIDDYVNPDYQLRYAVADARAFGAELKQRMPFATVEVVPLFNKEATRENILLALRLLSKGAFFGFGLSNAPPSLRLIRKAEPEDAVIVYFAGHGTAHDKQFYLIPHDLGYEDSSKVTREAALRLVLSHSISDRELEDAFETLDAGHLLLVIDACNSGQALEAEEKRRGPMNSKGLAQLAYEKGMYVLTAAQSFQAAQEVSELGHGLLTFVLVEEGLKSLKGDRNGDRELTEREWLDYAAMRVPGLQIEKMKMRAVAVKNPSQSTHRGTQLVFQEKDDPSVDPENRAVQRPRLFYRRELEANPLVVATRDPLSPN